MPCPGNRAIRRAAPIRRAFTTPRKLFLTLCADSFCALIREFFLSHKRFFPFRKKLFVTNFLTSVTNFVTRIRKFVICVTKFVINFFYMMVKTVCAGRKKCHGDNEKYLAANICHRLIRALQICSYKYAPLAAARHSPSELGLCARLAQTFHLSEAASRFGLFCKAKFAKWGG